MEGRRSSAVRAAILTMAISAACVTTFLAYGLPSPPVPEPTSNNMKVLYAVKRQQSFEVRKKLSPTNGSTYIFKMIAENVVQNKQAVVNVTAPGQNRSAEKGAVKSLQTEQDKAPVLGMVSVNTEEKVEVEPFVAFTLVAMFGLLLACCCAGVAFCMCCCAPYVEMETTGPVTVTTTAMPTRKAPLAGKAIPVKARGKLAACPVHGNLNMV
ncbi:uncharacterized protein LOC144161642 [Haemaphysalis longicornis]